MALHRNADELFDFKRIFTLMLGLVVLPTLLLSGFGILAIKNERAALEKRLQDAYQEKAQAIEQALVSRLAAHPEEIPTDVTANVLLGELVAKLFPNDLARFTLMPVTPPKQDRSTTEILKDLSPKWESFRYEELTQAPSPLVRYALPAPLQNFQLEIFLPNSDPVGDTMLKNTILYSSLMGLFLALVIVGVVITARFIHREVRISRLQTDFVSNISHELRTPLTSIRMFIETLQMGRARDEGEVQECLSIIALESERLTRMIERILNWARMEAGRRIYSFQSVPVRELVDQSLQAFRTQAMVTDFTLEDYVEPDLPAVRVDRTAMAEAVLNLLNNALKYTGEEKILSVKAYSLKGLVALEVADNGIGISTYDKKRIFEKFYRADALLSRKTEGSGLGLTMVRHVIEAHAGKIQVESELGAGSRFTLLIPVAESDRKQ